MELSGGIFWMGWGRWTFFLSGWGCVRVCEGIFYVVVGWLDFFYILEVYFGWVGVGSHFLRVVGGGWG